jgi:hypothetical protein
MTDVDRNATASLHFLFAVRWLGVRLDCLTIFITFAVAVVIVAAKKLHSTIVRRTGAYLLSEGLY